MPNVHLTEPMQNYVQGQIQSGAYANLSVSCARRYSAFNGKGWCKAILCTESVS